MPTQEKGIREMSGKPRCRFGEPKQDTDRRTEIVKGPLLCEDWITWAGSRSGDPCVATAPALPSEHHGVIWDDRFILYLKIILFFINIGDEFRITI